MFDLLCGAGPARLDLPASPSAGTFYRRWEAQPWLRWRSKRGELITAELAAFLSLGENRLLHPSGVVPERYGLVAEAKASAGVDFDFSPASRIGLYGTFDLDMPGKPWDGGSVRAQFLF